MKWELKQLKDAVREARGDRHADEMSGSLNAFFWKADMARYHASCVHTIWKDALAEVESLENVDHAPEPALTAIFVGLGQGEDGQKIRFARFTSEAHIIASAQALHSMFDIFAHIVYWACDLASAPEPLPLQRIGIHSVCRCLSKTSANASVETRVRELIDLPEFEYLSAFVNTTKHRSLVSSSFSAAFDEGRYGMRFAAFSYTDPRGQSRNYERKWAEDFLGQEAGAISMKFAEVGNSLNALYGLPQPD